jgi:hypothetical protein
MTGLKRPTQNGNLQTLSNFYAIASVGFPSNSSPYSRHREERSDVAIQLSG